MVSILMMSGKLVTLSLHEIKIFWNKGYDVIIYVNEKLESYGVNISKGGGWLRDIEQFWVMGNNDRLIFGFMSFLGRI